MKTWHKLKYPPSEILKKSSKIILYKGRRSNLKLTTKDKDNADK